MIIFPDKAIANARLNAVLESSFKQFPTKPSMIGNPPASPAPNTINPAKEKPKDLINKKVNPSNIIVKEPIHIFFTSVFLKILPSNKRITVIPTTNNDNAYNALLGKIESRVVRYVVVQLLIIASKLLWQKRKKAIKINSLSFIQEKL